MYKEIMSATEYKIMDSQYNNDLILSCSSIPLCSFAQYNANNSWLYYGNNRMLNNNNRYNANFRPRPVVDYTDTAIDYLISRSDPENPLVSYVGLDELLSIYIRCRNSKYTCIEFDISSISELIRVWKNVNNFTIRFDETRAFILYKPKIREIIFCPFRDKLVQSLYVMSINHYLESDWFHPDSYSCRKNKGVIKAIDTFQKYLYEESEGYTLPDIWISSFDIYHFFNSIDCILATDKITDFIREKFQDHPRFDLLIYLTRILYLTDYSNNIMIDKYYIRYKDLISPDKSLINNSPHIGVPIGNWPSQMIGNFLTTFVLIYIKGLDYKFIHYTDDTAIIVKDKQKYLKDINLIGQFYHNTLHLQIHPSKFKLQHYSKGITLLGRRLRFNRILPSEHTIHSVNSLFHDYISLAQQDPSSCKKYAEKFMRSINSYMGLLRTMNTYSYRKRLMGWLKNSPWKDVFVFDDNYRKVNMRCEYTTRYKYIEQAKIMKIPT